MWVVVMVGWMAGWVGWVDRLMDRSGAELYDIWKGCRQARIMSIWEGFEATNEGIWT